MLTFNTVLQCEGIAPASVRLVRHQDNRYPGRPTPYALWRAGDGRFNTYQRIQSRNVFSVGDLLAVFVATPVNDTLFVGMYAVDGIGAVPEGAMCPIAQQDEDVTDCHFYDLRPDDRLGRYHGLLVIDWGAGFRSWVQRAERQDKPVLEIRKVITDPAFPGFREFRCDVGEVEAIPFGWREALRSVNGVYVLVCQDSGKQYVGSAYGQDGLWGRLIEYARTGHGGNAELRRRGPARYQVGVLEVMPKTASLEEVIRAEGHWKDKLGTRLHGLNEN